MSDSNATTLSNGMRIVTELPKSSRNSGAGIDFVAEAKATLLANPGVWINCGEFKSATAQARKNLLVTKSKLSEAELTVATRKGETMIGDKHAVAVYARYTPVTEPVKVEKKKKQGE